MDNMISTTFIDDVVRAGSWIAEDLGTSGPSFDDSLRSLRASDVKSTDAALQVLTKARDMLAPEIKPILSPLFEQEMARVQLTLSFSKYLREFDSFFKKIHPHDAFLRKQIESEYAKGVQYCNILVWKWQFLFERKALPADDPSQKIVKILQDEKEKFEKRLERVRKLQLYSPVDFRATVLPATIARLLVSDEGKCNYGILDEMREVFVPSQDERDGVENEISLLLEQLRDDSELRTLIESIPVPSIGTIGDRIVRASLLMGQNEHMTAIHSRQVCLAACATWIRQKDLGDCYARAFLTQIKTISLKFLVRDFQQLIADGRLERTICNKSIDYIPLEILPDRAMKVRFLSRHFNNPPFPSLTAVLNCFENIGISRADVKKKVNEIFGSRVSLETLVSKFQISQKDRFQISFYAEAPCQNIFLQVYQNAVISMLVHPHGAYDLEEPENALRIAFKTLPYKDAVQLRQRLRLYYFPFSEKSCWAFCEQDKKGIRRIQNRKELLEFFISSLREKDPHVAVKEFLTSIQDTLDCSEVNESHFFFQFSGQKTAFLASRYFTWHFFKSIDLSLTAWAKFCCNQREQCGSSERISFCISVDCHTFRGLPNFFTIDPSEAKNLEDQMQKMSSSLVKNVLKYVNMKKEPICLAKLFKKKEVARQIREFTLTEDNLKEIFAICNRSIVEEGFSEYDAKIFMTMLCSWPYKECQIDRVWEKILAMAARVKKIDRESLIQETQKIRENRSEEPVLDVIHRALNLFNGISSQAKSRIIRELESAMSEQLLRSPQTFSSFAIPFADTNFQKAFGDRIYPALGFFWWNPRSDSLSIIGFTDNDVIVYYASIINYLPLHEKLVSSVGQMNLLKKRSFSLKKE